MNKEVHNQNLESNVWKYYFIEALSNFLLIMPIIVPFYQENGLNVTQLFLIQAAFSPFIGLINDTYTLPMALSATGISIFVFSIIALFYLHKNKVI